MAPQGEPMAVESVSGAGSVVEAALRRAASATGVDFGFLVRTAQRESGFNPTAQARTSSAAGLFQFVEQTWLATLKRHGSEHGYGRYASMIQEGADGRFRVSDPDWKRSVMDLRYDAHAASIMAGSLATDHAAYLRGRIGRDPTGGELYAAHFLGPQGSARLIEAMQSAPQATAASYFPDAAGANRPVFYRNGQALTVAELYANLSNTGNGPGGGVPIEEDPGQAAFVSYASARRGERERQEAMLVDMLLTGSGRESPLTSMFSAELMSLLTQARNDAQP
jgi:hypothetical protein